MTDIMHAESITSAEALRAHYGEPPAMVVAMIKTFLDEHHQNFIRHSPFVCVPVFAQKCWDDKLRKKFCKALQYWLSERMKGVKLQRNHLSPAEGNLAWDRQEVLHHA